MKKFFMLLAVAGFFSMTTISCGGDAAAEGEATEEAAEGEATEEAAEGDHDHAAH